jgi:hypothetical protein
LKALALTPYNSWQATLAPSIVNPSSQIALPSEALVIERIPDDDWVKRDSGYTTGGGIGTTGGVGLGPPPEQYSYTHSTYGLQLCCPIPKCGQSINLLSDPEQITSSSQNY